MRRANQFMGKGNNHSLPFYGEKRKHDERRVPDQFLIARLGRSSTTYRQAIYVQRLLPASLPSGSNVTTRAFVGSNLPSRRHYFRVARNPGTIPGAVLIGCDGLTT